jgi:CheY-like chemotaxis protein
MKDGPLPKSIKKVLSTLVGEGQVTFVEKMSEADLVIFTEVHDIEREYNKEKSYAFLEVSPSHNKPTLPENCATLQPTELLLGLIQMIQDISKKLMLIAEVLLVSDEVGTTEVLPNAKRILVIEDTPKHQVSAKAGLAGHKLTVVTGYEEAMEILGKEKFDVVLTDLQMPMSSRTLGPDAFKLGQLVPYGLLLRDEAAHQGAKYVAVVTDLNHHADWVSAAFDHFSYPMQIEGARVMMMHAPMNPDGSKDWATALNKLMKD